MTIHGVPNRTGPQCRAANALRTEVQKRHIPGAYRKLPRERPRCRCYCRTISCGGVMITSWATITAVMALNTAAQPSRKRPGAP
jgi:hypothetical protein